MEKTNLQKKTKPLKTKQNSFAKEETYVKENNPL